MTTAIVSNQNTNGKSVDEELEAKEEYLSKVINAQDELYTQINEVDFISMGLMEVLTGGTIMPESVANGVSSLMGKHVSKLEKILQGLEGLAANLKEDAGY